MRHSNKYLFTTKLTRDTKGSEFFDLNFVIFVAFVVKFISHFLITA